MTWNRSLVYSRAEDFFRLNGHAVMRLTRSAAIAVCEQAATRQLVVVGVEGGIWHDPGFEARLDSIWDYKGDDGQENFLTRNNALAADFIKSEPLSYDVFIITMGKSRTLYWK